MNTTKEQNRNFADNFIDSISEVGSIMFMDFADHEDMVRKKETLMIDVEDKRDDDGVARHFYHKDKRVFTLYYGKQGIIIFKPKW